MTGNGYASLVFLGASVVTRGLPDPGADAVAVRDGEIIAVGRGDQIAELIGTRTEVVRLSGQSLLPGFQDAHNHPVSAGLDLLHCDLRGRDSVDGYLTAVHEYAAAHPDRDWVFGGGWSMDVFPGGLPHREMLDKVVSERPVYLLNRDGHGALANSRALELAGLDERSTDPPDGRIERDAGGRPTGLLHEGATDLVSRLLPAITEDQLLDGLLLGQRHLHALGITAWQDAIVGNYLGSPNPLPAYVRAAQRGQLTARVVGALWWQRERGAEQVDELVAIRDASGHGRFSPTTVKVMLDGIVETRTASMLAPYCGHDSEPAPGSFIEPEALKHYVCLLDAAGFQVHFHAVGDRAVREALDAIEAARDANGSNDNRHQIAHLDVVHPDDVGRFAALGAIANIQPLWATHEPQTDDYKLPLLGPQRSVWSFPFGALEAAGATIAAGSDWAVSSADPLQGIHVAVNRQRADLDVKPFFAEQRISLHSAITAYTAGSAFANHLEKSTGTIEPGKAADLVVLDGDVFADPATAIAGHRVAATYVAGSPVYQTG